jgi:hypothetical protein
LVSYTEHERFTDPVHISIHLNAQYSLIWISYFLKMVKCDAIVSWNLEVIDGKNHLRSHLFDCPITTCDPSLPTSSLRTKSSQQLRALLRMRKVRMAGSRFNSASLQLSIHASKDGQPAQIPDHYFDLHKDASIPRTRISGYQAYKETEGRSRIAIDQRSELHKIMRPYQSKSAFDPPSHFFSIAKERTTRNTHFLCPASVVATLAFFSVLTFREIRYTRRRGGGSEESKL